MHPILIKIGPITIYTYGFFAALAFLTAIFFAKREGKRLGFDPNKIMDLTFIMLLCGIIGSRVFFVLTEPSTFLNDPLEVFKIWKGGLVFYGGFIGGLGAGLIYMKKHHFAINKTLDAYGVAVAGAHAFGRMGCFFAGCCYGKPTDLPWGLVFTDPQCLARPLGVALHPTQLYEVFNNLTIFIILYMIRKRMKFPGQLFWTYVLMYGMTRPIIEIFRGDYRGEFIAGIFSVSQVIGWSMALLATAILLILRKRHQSASKTDA